MPTLHVRNVSKDLYRKLQEFAEQDKRSLTAEVISLLELAAKSRDRSMETRQILDRIEERARRFKRPPGMPSAVELIREDRDR